MTTDEMVEILRGVYVSGMNVMGNEWEYIDDEIAKISLCDPAIFNLGAEIGGQEDAVWNSIRFGFCEAVHTAVTTWLENGGELDHDNMCDHVRALVDACAEEPDPANVPWHLFRHAWAWAWPADLLAALDETLQSDYDRRYELEVRHTIEPLPDGISYRITTQIGGGWQVGWGAAFSFTVTKYATSGEFRDAMRAAYPDYLMGEVKNG